MVPEPLLGSRTETFRWLIKEVLVIASIVVFWGVVVSLINATQNATNFFLENAGVDFMLRREILSASGPLWEVALIIIVGSALLYALVRTKTITPPEIRNNA
ncbi:hypothetical protein [Natronobacterium texcoconense]|uniref:hypothetical protein n=1 Tax=Natronobacterium texcoconense TaxID=1095778 RepID=UPI00111351EB|nr:hypothetical protein [Natronobacterium texcoconense]